RRPQSAGFVSALRGFSGSDRALPQIADRVALLPRRAADQWRAGVDRRGRRRIFRRHPRGPTPARPPPPRHPPPAWGPPPVRAVVSAVGDRHPYLSFARRALPPAVAALARKCDRGTGGMNR